MHLFVLLPGTAQDYFYAVKAATERKIIRWLHIIASIPVIGYIYGPVKDIPNAVMAIRWVIFPLIVLSGLWLWRGHLVRKWIIKKNRNRGLKAKNIS